METIFVSDGNTKITFFIDNSEIYYINHNNSFVCVKKYLNLLRVNNPNDFFNKNGHYNILYKGAFNSNKTHRKIFKFGKIIVIASLTAITTISAFNKEVHELFTTSSYSTTVYTIDYFRNKIITSSNLSIEEKEYLYNRDFLEDILPFVNFTNYQKYKFDMRFTNLDIIPFLTYYKYPKQIDGYYTSDLPNILHVNNYDKINDNNKDTIAHEYIHLCQAETEYNLIIEACAEIISSEYFENTNINAYTEQVKLIKTLMEIIGSYPIWYFNFTGDFSLIEKKVKPYLTEKEYNEFLECLTFNQDDIKNMTKFKKLNELLSALYQNIYGQSINNDIVINLIKRNDKGLKRYYFNSRYTESYYLDYENATYQTIDLDTALNERLVFILAIKSTPISFEKAKEYLTSEEQFNIRRDIDYKLSGNSISVYKTYTTGNKQYISAFIGSSIYEDVDVDELVEKGLIKVNYYLIDSKYLTAEEYINHEFDEESKLYITSVKDLVINDDYTVLAKIPPKIYIPSIFEKENNTTTKKHVILNMKRG